MGHDVKPPVGERPAAGRRADRDCGCMSFCVAAGAPAGDAPAQAPGRPARPSAAGTRGRRAADADASPHARRRHRAAPARRGWPRDRGRAARAAPACGSAFRSGPTARRALVPQPGNEHGDAPLPVASAIRGGSRDRWPRGWRSRRHCGAWARWSRAARQRVVGDPRRREGGDSPSISSRAARRSNGPGPCRRRRRRHGGRGHEDAAADAHLDPARDLERDDRFAHRGARHAEQRGELALGRQPRAAREFAAVDEAGDLPGDLPVQPSRSTVCSGTTGSPPGRSRPLRAASDRPAGSWAPGVSVCGFHGTPRPRPVKWSNHPTNDPRAAARRRRRYFARKSSRRGVNVSRSTPFSRQTHPWTTPGRL